MSLHGCILFLTSGSPAHMLIGCSEQEAQRTVFQCLRGSANCFRQASGFFSLFTNGSQLVAVAFCIEETLGSGRVAGGHWNSLTQRKWFL
jgi:hypothetical protein